MKRLTQNDWRAINAALAFYEADDLTDEAELYALVNGRDLHADLRSARSKVSQRLAGDSVSVRCYLCGENRPKDDTEVTRHVVPSATRGGTVRGVNRYVRMCRVGEGCRG